jgi:hypothetical protein
MFEKPYNAAIYESAERCCQCNRRIVRLAPPYEGHWEFYCLVCRALVTPARRAQALMERLPVEHPGAVGIVVAVPFELPIPWERPAPEEEPSP